MHQQPLQISEFIISCLFLGLYDKLAHSSQHNKTCCLDKCCFVLHSMLTVASPFLHYLKNEFMRVDEKWGSVNEGFKMDQKCTDKNWKTRILHLRFRGIGRKGDCYWKQKLQTNYEEEA